MTIFKDVPVQGVKVVPCRVNGPRGIVKAFIVASGDGVVLIDTGFSDEDGDRIVSALGEIGRTLPEVALCVLTHSHGDHVGGLKRLRSLHPVKVAAHVRDAEAIRKRTGCAVDVALSGGETLPYAGGLEILHLPGHSPGSLSVYYRATRSLFTGDVLFSAGEHIMPSPAYLSDDPEQAVRSATSLAARGLAIDNLFVAHGDDVYGGATQNLQRILSGGRVV